MNRKIWKALGIAVCMLALAAPRAMAKTYEVGMDASFIKFGDAVEAINQSGDAENEIVLMENITLGGNYILTNSKKTTIKTTTIKGEGNTITVNPGAGITVAGEKTVLNLGANGYDGTLTIDGKTSGGFVSVLEGATANMYEHVTLQNWQFAGNACVVIMGSESVFNMHGGVIEKCSRAVMADSGTTFHMLGGKILNCVSGNDGGGIFLYKATFIMDGGIISGCEGLLGGGLYAEKSSTVNINNGTISGCTAGAGGGLYVVGSTLNIKGGTISECFVSDTGKGGGLFADQSTLTISGGTIKGNKAAYGGGVALRDSRVKEEEPITNWTVVDNKAYKTKTGTGYVGGGIYLENGSMNASAGSNKIYNNTADGHGADICLDGSSTIKLPNAAGMGAKYHDSGIKIDNWYNDNPRYTPSENGEVVGAGVELKGGLSLVASYKASPVRIEIDANGGVGGSGSQTVQKGTNVTLEAPTKEGYLFKGWKDDKGNSYPAGADGKVNITVNEDMKLTAVWEARTFTVTYVLLNGKTRTEKVDYGQMVTLSEEPRTGYTFVGWKDGEKMYHAGETITVTGDMTLTAEWKKLPSAENLPKTGDESPVLLWGAALAVSAAACFMLRRRK
ncbi:InlB B-repeat-containing protein [Hominenteromicrobium sp.]|uniref:InlB B-repeat-containing protein n=1 Tax=Hominenteromicrobium sp. TaxID=3073581 RepID=UPI003A952357